MPVTVIKSDRIRTCGFCATGTHSRCIIGTANAKPKAQYPGGSIILCQCEEGGCTQGRIRCTNCNTRDAQDVDPETWQCFDRNACEATVEARRAADPLLVQIRESRRRADMAKIEDNKVKAEKVAAEKPVTLCLVTGEPTKGGKFKPGMDARYVSERVAEVHNANYSAKAVDAARKRLKSDGISDTLTAKFEKSLNLSKEREEKKVAAKAEKEKAKAEKATASASA